MSNLRKLQEKAYFKDSIIVAGIVSIGIFTMIIFFSYLSGGSGQAYTKGSVIKRQFDPQNGEHIKFSKRLKLTLKHPESYEHVETTYVANAKNRQITVRTEFLEQNDSGIKEHHTYLGKYSFNGKFIDIEKTDY